ncbi:MAG: choice-of-anchor E domain-containing protein [Planctomycetes bacterium]|nr:choice-of-anchor E domain-containing protein [Planctomycetota bacterium]
MLLPKFTPAPGTCARLIQAELQFEGGFQGEFTVINHSVTFPCTATVTAQVAFEVTNPAILPAPCAFLTTSTNTAGIAPGSQPQTFLQCPVSVACPDVTTGAPPLCFTDPVLLASEFTGPPGSTLRFDHLATLSSWHSGCGPGTFIILTCARIRARVLYTYCTASTPGASFCAGDGLDPAVTTPCPCGNVGAAGHGCANSVNAAGALLDATGCSVVQPDTVALLASGMSGTTPVTFFKGDQSAAGGVPFFDGVRCVDGALVRLATNPSSAGTSSYPLPGQPALSVRGNTPVGSGLTGYYQVSYRNAALAFCPPATANVTNGYSIVW